MKFAAGLSYVLVALVAGAVADPQGGRQGNGKGGFGGFGGGSNAGNNAKGGNGNSGANAGGNANNSTTGGNTTSTSTDAAASAATASSTVAAAGGNSADAQDSTTLDPAVVATGFALDGQQVPTAGQVASLTSKNNFINFCLTVNMPITNGQQVKTGSCNPAPMGVIAATTNMPSSKFVFPPNGGTIQANQEFTIQMAISNIETGNFVNAANNYYSAPQQVNAQGEIIGHSHVVIEQLSALDQTTTTDPNTFAFFKGINGAAQNGVVTADVTAGLPAGVYRLASINAAANHQPVLVAIAQHGSLDDMVYFTVSDNGAAANNTGATNSTGNATGNNNTGATNSTGNATGNNNAGANNGTQTGNNGATGANGAANGATGANGAANGQAQGGNKQGGAGGFGGRNGRGRGRALRFARDA